MATKILTEEEYSTPIYITSEQAKKIISSKPIKINQTRAANNYLTSNDEKKSKLINKIMGSRKRERN